LELSNLIFITIRGVPIKNNPLEETFCISAKIAWIRVKLLAFVWEYWHNISCKFYWTNWYDSTDTAV